MRDIELLNGRFTPEKIQTLASSVFDIDDVDDVFVCGPELMIFMIREELIKLGLPKDKVHFELFVSGLSEENKVRSQQALAKRKEGTEITIMDGGKAFHFVMTKAFDSILDAALAEGADLPFACKGGVCSTCKCQVIEGEVEMKVNYALEQNEVDNNFVLSCQAVPTSEKVVVDFDV
jgi:ring-1,2-phenylacetyl-CoA epoxidase subunit PaaE